ncbi:hypothetical protein M407DRAFT_218652 [Tulasnella calospora MUT 4182]|uniref:Cystathionine gamma-synthase n=1 Tax=Tulasnella calospora MUT 4182 TaxID=1051891 RepID=A0A0C3ML59_9AGAM|nr:hypothetical protein M407DRAFT_218652 [Tulasnella calospora MUT 4182]
MSTAETSVIATALGRPVPYLPHAVSVSMPTWNDNRDFIVGDARVVDALATGYPRFMIHPSVQLLARICEDMFGNPGERCMLLSSAKLADAMRSFLLTHSPSPIVVRIAQHVLPPSAPDTHNTPETRHHDQSSGNHESRPQQPLELHIVFFPAESFKLAKLCWKYTGHGISSRRADKCLELLGTQSLDPARGLPTSTTNSRPQTPNNSSPGGSVESLPDIQSENQTMMLVQCHEEPLPYDEARLVLQRRIARALEGDFSSASGAPPSVLESNGSGTRILSDDDVYLYLTGMNAIWHAHQLILQTTEKMGKVAGKSICFGFPFTDTLKLLQKWGPGCHFFGFGADDDLSDVRRVAQEAASSGTPIVALFCEVPTNPLLRTPNMVELRKIADEFDFLIVADDTIGNFVNVDVMKYSDIVVTSLTKVFSGRCNVMGGSLVLNPQRSHYNLLRDHLKTTYKELCWHEDVVCLEVNSRHFARRIDVINRNAEAVADWLWNQSEACDVARGQSQSSNAKKRVVSKVFFPKWETRENYDACRRRPTNGEVAPLYPSGFGSFFTILFSDEAAARAFYDNLGCEKGPTWGTNFTIACPYTVLAHYFELDWAAGWGVPINVVRVSVGMEDQETILGWMKYALAAAQNATEPSS